MNKINLLIIATLSATSGLAQAETTLRFGVDPSFPPFESKAPDGQLVGFDIDLGNAICAQAQVKCEWVETAYDGIIPALNAKKFDAVLSAMSMTPKRKTQVNFSDMLYHVPSVLIAKKGSGLQPTADSLKGKTVGVAQGTTQEAYAQGEWQKKGVDVISYQNQDFVNQDLASGRIDVTLTNAAAAETGFLKTPEGAGYAFAGEPLTDTRYLGEGTAIGLRKDDQAHLTLINNALAEIHKNGTYQTLEKKYFTFAVYNKKS